MSTSNKFWVFAHKIAIISGIVAAIAACIALYLQFKKDRNKIEVRIKSVDILTNFSSIEGLNGIFSFKGKKIKNLYLVKIEFQNTGTKTIIGRGKKSDLISDNISFSFDKNLKIVEFPTIEKSNIYPKIKSIDSLSFSMEFDQWRTGEIALYKIFFTSNISNPNFYPIVNSRNIIDGDIELSKDQDKKAFKKEFFIQLFPSWLVNLILALITIVWFLLSCALIIDIFKQLNIKDKIGRWESEIFPKFLDIVNSNKDIIVNDPEFFRKTSLMRDLSRDQRITFLTNPYWYTDKFWNAYNLPKKTSEVYNAKTTKNSLVGLIIFLFIYLIILPYVKLTWIIVN